MTGEGRVSSAGPSASPSHVTVITSDDLGLRYWPGCACGWAPYAVPDYAAAFAACEDHKREQAHV